LLSGYGAGQAKARSDAAQREAKGRGGPKPKVQEVERHHSQSHRHRVAVAGKGVNERKRQKIKNERCNRSDNIRAKKQMDEEQSEQERREPYDEQRRFISRMLNRIALEKPKCSNEITFYGRGRRVKQAA
jgi:hypothetical protein